MICRHWRRFSSVGVSIPLVLLSAALAARCSAMPTQNPENATGEGPAASATKEGAAGQEQVVHSKGGIVSVQTVPQLTTLVEKNKRVLLLVGAPDAPVSDPLLQLVRSHAPASTKLVVATAPPDSNIARACGHASFPTVLFWESGGLLGQLQDPIPDVLDGTLAMWLYLGAELAQGNLVREQGHHNAPAQLKTLKASLSSRPAIVGPAVRIWTPSNSDGSTKME